MDLTNWDEKYRTGEVFWDRAAPSPPMRQYLQRHPVRGRTLVPGCGHGHYVPDVAFSGREGRERMRVLRRAM